MTEWTRERIVQAAKDAAGKCKGPLTRSEFCRQMGITGHCLYRLFPERGWTELRQLAGIQRHPKDKYGLSDEDFLKEFHRVASALRAIPTWIRFESCAKISAQTLLRRFGSRANVLQRYRSWLEGNDPGSPLLPLLRGKTKQPAPLAVPAASVSTKEVLFGAPLDFGRLRHAPTNENGVIYLFGMLSSEFDLIVEAIQCVYPDCEAKRCVDNKQKRWRRVRIEFEFVSSNFRDHGHDPAGCDLIVCWEHNWPECPLEVIELRSVVDRLKRFGGEGKENLQPT